MVRGLDAGQVKLAVGHALAETLIVDPVFVYFLHVERGLLLLQATHESFVFNLDVLHLPFPVELVEAFVDLAPDVLGLVDGVGPLLGHDAGDLLKEDFVLPLDLYLTHLPDHLPLCVVDEYGVVVGHVLGGHWLHVAQVDRVVGVLNLLLFDLHKTVDVGSVSVHRFQRLSNKINSLYLPSQIASL